MHGAPAHRDGARGLALLRLRSVSGAGGGLFAAVGSLRPAPVPPHVGTGAGRRGGVDPCPGTWIEVGGEGVRSRGVAEAGRKRAA